MHNHSVLMSLMRILWQLKSNRVALSECQIWGMLAVVDRMREMLLRYFPRDDVT